jgi:hypothetical protein
VDNNKHFVISFLKGKVVVLRTIHHAICPFLAGLRAGEALPCLEFVLHFITYNNLTHFGYPANNERTSSVFSAVDFHEYLASTSFAPFIYGAGSKSG